MPDERHLERLRTRRIEPEFRLFDLRVMPDAVVELCPDDARFKELATVLQPRSGNELIEWLGVPGGGEIIEGEPPREIPAHLVHRGDSELMRRATEIAGLNFAGRTDHLNEESLGLLDRWAEEYRFEFPAFVLNDIYVHRGAQLMLASPLLLARYITVEHGGTIVIPAGRHTKIDCRGIQSQSPISSVNLANKYILKLVA